jgi:hypothetical protein
MSCQTATYAFFGALVVTIIGLLIYFMKVYTRVKENEPADEESRKMYFETFKTVVTAAGLAIPVIGATLKNGLTPNLWMLQRSAMYLLAAVALAVITLLEMSRRYEGARLRDVQPSKSLTESAKEIGEKIKNSSGGDYREALELALEYCRKRTGVTGLKKNEVGWLCIWAYLSILSFMVGLLYVVRFVTCF